MVGCSSKTKGGDRSPPFSTCDTAAGVQVEGPQYKKGIVSCPSKPMELASVLHQASSGAGPGDIEGGAENWGFFSLETRRLNKDLIAVLSYLMVIQNMEHSERTRCTGVASYSKRNSNCMSEVKKKFTARVA